MDANFGSLLDSKVGRYSLKQCGQNPVFLVQVAVIAGGCGGCWHTIPYYFYALQQDEIIKDNMVIK